MSYRRGKDPLLFSLRVLARAAKGFPPSRRNLIILKRLAAITGIDLTVQELCGVVIEHELDRGSIGVKVSAADEGQQRLVQLEWQARYLAGQHKQQKITDREYLELLNVVRQRYGLEPIAGEYHD